MDRSPLDPAAIRWDLPARPYPAALCAFLHSLRVGASWHDALRLFATLPDGHFSKDGRIFGTPALRLPGGCPTHQVQLTEPDGPDSLTLLFASESLVAICSSRSVLPRPTPDRKSNV